MSNQMDHDRFSELLPGYVRDDLSADEKSAVQSHLETCSDCREELAGLRALVEAEVPKLDDFERRRIHAAVAKAIGGKEEPEDEPLGVWVPPRRKQSLMARFAPTMGVAALLILLAVGAFTLGGGSEIGTDSGGSALRGDLEQGGSGDLNEQSGGGGAAEPAPETAPDAGTEAGSPGTVSDRALNGPQPRFKRHRAFLAETLQAKNAGDDNLAGYVQQDVFAEFWSAYSVRDAERNEDAYLSLLSRRAPAGLRGQVKTCGDRVREATDEPILPAYGTVAEFDARRSLLLGFVYTKSPRGKLSNYMLWAWPKGSCEQTLGYTEGTVHR